MTTAFLAPALALAGCNIYLGDDAPQTPSPAPWLDAGVWPDAAAVPPADAAPPPGWIELSLPVQEALGERTRHVEITRLYQNDAPDHEILSMSGIEDQLIIASQNADYVSVSLHEADGELLDTTLIGTHCPTPARVFSILEVPVEYDSIQQAIDSAIPGNIVYVHPGTYREHLKMRMGVRLIGAGASRTILDGEGIGESLIDFSNAPSVTIRGFTLRNVGQGQGCANPDDPFECSGDWYAAAIYADGHDGAPAFGPGCPNGSAVITHNIIEGNQIGVMLYYFAPAVIRNNLFLGNNHALAINRLSDSTLVANNTFVSSESEAIADGSGHLDLINNIIARSPTGLRYEREEATPNHLSCNIFFEVDNPGDHVGIGEWDNAVMDPSFRDEANNDYRLRPESPALGLDCFAQPELDIVTAPGAYGGLAGGWYEQPIEVDDLAANFGV